MLSQTMSSRLCYKSVVMFLSSSAIINSWALAASNINKQRENNSSAIRKGGSPAGSYVCSHLGKELVVKHAYISNLRLLMEDQLAAKYCSEASHRKRWKISSFCLAKLITVIKAGVKTACKTVPNLQGCQPQSTEELWIRSHQDQVFFLSEFWSFMNYI